MARKCDSCGCESPVEEAFVKVRYWNLRKRTYCPSCWLKQQTSGAKRTLQFYLAIGILGGVLVLVGVEWVSWAGWFLLNVFLFFVFYSINIRSINHDFITIVNNIRFSPFFIMIYKYIIIILIFY